MLAYFLFLRSLQESLNEREELLWRETKSVTCAMFCGIFRKNIIQVTNKEFRIQRMKAVSPAKV